ncbi:MAG TPA: succinylglutamate desuccinylase/aspartoacylase family protein [Verrucomicrobiae bacterium]|nr:succinylglutamate desuccinylase/aspartoacylase family protein [Verrucomicrobiae bacterium]
MISRILEVPAGSDAGTQIPITTFHGPHDGPRLALIAGNHGYEYPPILALQKLYERIDERALRGSITMVHVANMPSFLGRTVYFSPVDGKNLNRCYPGRADGTVSERIAHAITTEVIDQADVVLDLHCGDGNEWLRPYVYQSVTADEALNLRIARLALAFGIDHVLVDRGRPVDPAKSVYCSTTAVTRRKPAMTVEAGSLGQTDAESVETIVSGVRGVMRDLGMTEDGPPALDKAVYLDPSVVVTSPETGILYPLVRPDQRVKKGEALARITDFFARVVAMVESPIDGVVLYVVATPPMVKGQPVACVGTPR